MQKFAMKIQLWNREREKENIVLNEHIFILLEKSKNENIMFDIFCVIRIRNQSKIYCNKFLERLL